jgi:hypothetical protein
VNRDYERDLAIIKIKLNMASNIETITKNCNNLELNTLIVAL